MANDGLVVLRGTLGCRREGLTSEPMRGGIRARIQFSNGRSESIKLNRL